MARVCVGRSEVGAKSRRKEPKFSRLFSRDEGTAQPVLLFSLDNRLQEQSRDSAAVLMNPCPFHTVFAKLGSVSKRDNYP